MHIYANDIIVRSYQDKDQLWLSQALIMRICEISDGYLRFVRNAYKKSVRSCDIFKAVDMLPDTGKAWRWAKWNNTYYYAYNNLPNRSPQHYKSKFGNEADLLEHYQDSITNRYQNRLETQLNQHVKECFVHYLEHYPSANEVQRIALAKACAVLDFVAEKKDQYLGTKLQLFKDLQPILERQQIKYLPHHYRKLKEKIDGLQEDNTCIVDLIQLPRMANKNARIYTDTQVNSWVMQLRSMPQNYSDAHIIRKVMDLCEIHDKEVPSQSWFKTSILNTPKNVFLTGNKRFGTGKRSSIHNGYIPRENALFSGDCWEMDSTRINFIAHEVEVSIDGKRQSKYIDKFLIVVVIRDNRSGDIVGYAFDHSENHVVYTQAMKMAVRNTGYLPYEIVTDRFPGHNTPQMENLFERLLMMGIKTTFSHDANRKARVERFFATLQSVQLMDSDYYYGEGVQSRRISAHRSPEHLKQIKNLAKKTGWDMNQAVEMASEMIEDFRRIPYHKYSRKYAKITHSPMELHEDCEKPHVKTATKMTISMLFDLQKNVTIKNSGQIVTEIVGTEMHYFIPETNYDIISNYHNQQVVMTYDIEDLSQVYLWQKHGKLLQSLCIANYFEKPQTFGPNPRMQQVGVAKARQKVIAEKREQDLQESLGEENLLMGAFTNKKKAIPTEDDFLGARIEIKKASGDGLSNDAIEHSLLNDYSDY